MAYNEELDSLITDYLEGEKNIEPKKMFGGVGYLLNGNMACGVHTDHLIVRVGPENYEDALSDPHTKIFDMTGRPMRGWVMVSSEAWKSPYLLKKWIDLGITFAVTVPPK